MRQLMIITATAGLGLMAPGCARKGGNKPAPGGAENTAGVASTAAPITSSIKYYNHFPFNHVYTTDIAIGSQQIETVLDTGSSNLLAIGAGSHCPGCVNEYGYTSVYTPGSGAKALASSWSISFLPIGSATVAGYQDDVSFSGIDLPAYQLGLVTQEKGIPNIWGLGYQVSSSPNANPQTPPFEAMIAEAHLANQFSLRLCATAPGSNMVLGGFDSSVQLTSVHWAPLTSRGSYSVGVTRAYLAGSSTDPAAAPLWSWQPEVSDLLIVDSGTNPITIATAEVAPLVAQLAAIAKKNGVVLPASFWPTATAPGGYATLTAAEIAKFPPLLFDIAGSSGTFTLSVAPTTYFQLRDNGQRYLGIEPGGPGIYLLGTVAMENYVVLFDRGDLAASAAAIDPTARLGFFPITGLCH